MGQFHIGANIIKLFIESFFLVRDLINRVGVMVPRIQVDRFLSHVEFHDVRT